jgi:H+/Cl- antiporter ClcA
MRYKTLLSARHWKSRLVMWTAAAAVGVAAVGFAKIADLAQFGLRKMIGFSAAAPWLLAPGGFAVIAWLTRRYFRGAEGSGIPQTIFAQRPDSGAAGRAFLEPRVVVGRVALAGVGLLCGGSIGREGPTVHVGAVIIHTASRWMPKGRTEAYRRSMILAGGAAGVAAAFNTPLAGIVFAIEELSKSFEERASGATLTAVILAGVVAIALVGNYNYFGQPLVAAGQSQVIEWTTLLVALTCGVSGGVFSRVTLLTTQRLPGALGRLRSERPALFAGLCGLGIAGLGAWSGGLTYGTGYEEARSILENQAHLPWSYAPARAVATLLSYLSGIPAGLLAPSLSVGAGLGQFMADHLDQPSVPFAILGMCGFLAGVTQAPLTSFVIVMEMTSQHAMVLPLMLTAAVATALSKLVSPPLYQTLADRYGAPDQPRADSNSVDLG